jgi:hypothetical protein
MAEGVLKVSVNGRSVEYRSLAEMQQLEQSMAAELEAATIRPRRIYPSFKRA